MFCGNYRFHTKLRGKVIWTEIKRNHKTDHWSFIDKKRTPKDKALRHFDDFYSSVYGEKAWKSIRLGLLCPNKFCAVINNYCDPDAVMTKLQNRGALDMNDLFESYKINQAEIQNQDQDDDFPDTQEENISKLDDKMQSITSEIQSNERTSIYPKNAEIPDDKQILSKGAKNPKQDIYVEKLSLEESLAEAWIDQGRIINPNDSLSATALYEFVPATKIKSLDNDFVPESQHYGYFKRNVEFPIDVVEETAPLQFPGNLKVYTYEKCNVTSFLHPSKGVTGKLDYFLLDGASILPILALDLKSGDRMLDMCAAPGGKSLTALQSCWLDKLVCNDVLPSRVNRIHKIMNEYLFVSDAFKDVLKVSQLDALLITNKEAFNKILVDVPCTNDRISVKQDEGNLFQPKYVKDRLKLPELQSELLSTAIKLLPVGGTVVYSTCTLSPVQNDGVIQMALQKIWEDTNFKIVVKDLRKTFAPIESVYYVGKNDESKYGMLIQPNLTANFGPLYFSKLVRVR